MSARHTRWPLHPSTRGVPAPAAGKLRFGEPGGDLKLSAQGAASLKGSSATLEGQSEAKVKGPQVGIAGNTQFSPS